MDIAKKNMRFAILSTCWGMFPQVLVRDSSIVIIFAAMLGAGETVTVLTTGMSDVALCLLMLPFAMLSDRVGVKPQIIVAHSISAMAFMLIPTAAWFGDSAPSMLVLTLIIFAVAGSAYSAAWFPLLEGIVPANQRGLFFGRLRVRWQIVSTIFILLSGWFVGRYATLGRLQVIITMGGLLSLGRVYYISRIQAAPRPEHPMQLGSALTDALRNRPLTGFGVYLFFLYLSANATIPVIFVFARNHLKLPDNLIVLYSSISMGGLILGFMLGGQLVHRCGVKRVLLAAHIGFALLNLFLLTVHSRNIQTVILLGLILIAYGILTACASIAVSSELLSLASPVNKAVSIAFGSSLFHAGLGSSRLAASMVLGSGILAESWRIGEVSFTRYHSIFLISGLGVTAAMILLVLVPGMVHDVDRLPAA